jgi:hypothetical protein
LNCFCDKDKKLVTNTTRISKSMIATTSQPGLKLILPAILNAMSDKNSQKKLGIILLPKFSHSSYCK